METNSVLTHNELDPKLLNTAVQDIVVLDQEVRRYSGKGTQAVAYHLKETKWQPYSWSMSFHHYNIFVIAVKHFSKCLATEADQLILTQYAIVIAYCLRAPKGSPSIPSDYVTELYEQVNKIMLERIR